MEINAILVHFLNFIHLLLLVGCTKITKLLSLLVVLSTGRESSLWWRADTSVLAGSVAHNFGVDGARYAVM